MPFLAALIAWVALSAIGGPASACTTDAECDDGNPCNGREACHAGTCGEALSLPFFPVGAPGATAYDAPVISVMDHSDPFYGRCCDTEIVAYTGETAVRGAENELCPEEPVFPACVLNSVCICGYAHPEGESWVVNGNYQGAVFGPHFLSYAGHAGYDYRYPAGTPIVAARAGVLCKAREDPVNGRFPAPTAWDQFHTFYIDHGVVGGLGYATWYLHAAELAGEDAGGDALADLAVGACAPVAAGQLVAIVGNFGTFAPHLHFEVRRHPPDEGPESTAARVVDPYGWTGAGDDPWLDPLENPQAAHNPTPLWEGCGNGRLDCGEECDDGDPGGGCCSSSCTFEPAGTACSLANGPCADERCDGGGACVDLAAPREDCKATVLPGRSQLRVYDRPGAAADRLVWRWAGGEATTAADLGDPTASDGYRLCVFDLSATPRAILEASAPAGGSCPRGASTRPCWTAKGNPPPSRGYLYVDPGLEPDGVARLEVVPGAERRARITLRAQGEPLALPPLPLPLPLRVELRVGDGACWAADYRAERVKRNDARSFAASGD